MTDWTSFNRCNLPPWVIGSRHYNEDPQPIEIQGVLRANRFLFATLDTVNDPDERARRFDDWISVRFQLHHWQEQSTDSSRRSLKNSYLRFLRGWGVDSSSVEGAVMKSWVESRMGIRPTFHRERIDARECEAYMAYARDQVRGMACTNAIHDQLDLVYAYTQYELARRLPGEKWLTLYRGQNDVEEDVVEKLGPREQVVRLNNLCSFTDDRERAWEFGSTVWEARIGIPRIFFASCVFPKTFLKGEGEYIVIGGEMRVRRLAC